ncbi:MAG: VWA domain-containing protein [Vicinamibacterales bacterium]
MVGRRLHAVVLCVLCAAALTAQQQTQPPPTFRSGTTVVPVDVRVVDRSGKPITDLTPSDFTVLEDGVPQKIVHFSFQALEPAKGAAVDPPLALRKPLGEAVTPQNKRIFLIVLGRGRQVGPVKGVEGAMRFVKQRLLPQDQVSVLAYNRSTDFTTDHTKVIETLDRYWKKHQLIEAKLKQHFSGLAAVYGGTDIPAPIQTEIDGIFRVPGALTSRTVDATGITDAARIADDERKNRDLIQRAELATERQQAGLATPFDQSAIDEAAMLDYGFDEYVQKSFDTRSDLGNLYAGLRYLRWLDGEKHLVFISPTGLFLPRLEDANSIASMANDARVTVDIIHTYGTAPAQMLNSRGSVVMAPAFGQVFQNQSSRQIAALTGGQMTTIRTGDAFFKLLDDTTRAQYLLGYSPSNNAWDGKYRRIQVRVNRKGAQVLYRHGYAGRRESAPMDRQRYLAYTRIASAANLPRNIDDLKLSVGEPTVAASGERHVLSASLRIPAGAIKLQLIDGFHVGKVELVAFSGDRREAIIGEMGYTLELKLTEPNYERFMRDGTTLDLTMRLTGEPASFKVILYDHTADLIGSLTVPLKSVAPKRK